MEEAFVSLVTAFLLDNNDMMSSHPTSSNPLAQASEVHQAPVEEDDGDGDHDCYDFIPSFKDFMVPQRDRAFSWDVSFENGLHSDMAGGNGNIPTNMHDLFPTHHQVSTGPVTSEDATRLTIKAKFPAKSGAKKSATDNSYSASLPVMKSESKRKDSFGGIDHLDHEDILDDDDDAADDFFEDPLLLSIPPDLLIEGSGLSLQQSSSNAKKSRSRVAGSSKDDKPNKRSKTTPKAHHSHSEGSHSLTPPAASSSGMTVSQDLYLSVAVKSENGLGPGSGKQVDSQYSTSAGVPVGYTGNGHSVHSSVTTSASSNSYLSSLSSGSHYNHSSLNGNGGVKPAGGGSLNYANPLNTLAYSNYNHSHQNQPYSSYSSSASTGNNLTPHHAHHSSSHHHHHHPHAMHEKRVGIYTIEERRMKIEKFREKKRQRIWRKQIKYDCRKRLADTRPRVKGRFVSRKNQGADGAGNPFGSPCGSKDATTNEQSDEDDSVGGTGSGLHMHAPTTAPRQPTVPGATTMTNTTAMKYPQSHSQPLTATVGGLHNPTTLSSQYGGYHHALPSSSSLNEKGEYSIGGGVLAHTSSATPSATATPSNHHHYNGHYPVHSSLSSSSNTSLHSHHHYVPPSYNTIGNTASLLNQHANPSTTVSRFSTPLSTVPSSVNSASVPMSIGGSAIPPPHSINTNINTSSTTTATQAPTVSGYGSIHHTTTHSYNTHSNSSQSATTMSSSSSMHPPTTNLPVSSTTNDNKLASQSYRSSYSTPTINSIPPSYSSTAHTGESTKTADRIL